MVDHVFERLTFSPHKEIDVGAAHHPNKLAGIPWAPSQKPDTSPTLSFGVSDPLPKTDVVLVTWTAAEWEAMCDVLTGNGNAVADREYAHNFSNFEPNLTPRSPARFAKCLAKARLVLGNKKSVLLLHSNLHISTDSAELPLYDLLDQIIEETQCNKIITTGTAGGIGSDKELGDVIIGNQCTFNCNRHLKNKPYNHKSFPTSLAPATSATASTLTGANIAQLADVRSISNSINYSQGIETTDFFAFDTSNDHFGLQQASPTSGAVEMDDAVLGLVIEDRKKAAKHTPFWGAVRNVSDPQADMSKYATFEDASRDMGRIYRRYGYWTTVPSVIESWLMGIQ